MWELDYKEGWASKNWCFWNVVLEKTLESPLNCKDIQPDHSEGDQPWDFFGRTYAKAETPVLWPPHAKSWLIGKDSDAGRDWGQEEKGTTEDAMASPTWWTWVWVNSGSWWWTGRPGVHESQESDMTEWLNWTELKTSLDLPLWSATPQLGKGLRNQNTKVELKTTKEKKDWGEVLEMLELNRGQSRLHKSHFLCPYSFHGFWDDLHQAWNSHSEGNPM